MFQEEDKYYQHSGVIGLTGPIYMTLFGTIAALALGAIYGYAIFYIPFIYLNFFITLLFGAGVGFSIHFGAKIGKVRNTKALLAFGFILGCLAEYVGWVSWIFALSQQEALVLMPWDIFHILQRIAEDGAWNIFGWTASGFALYAIWAIEGVMIIGTSTLVSSVILSSTPFCEDCEEWIEEKHTIGFLDPVTDPEELKQELERADYTLFNSLKKQETTTNAYTEIDLLHCPDCSQNHYMTINSVKITIDSKKKEDKASDIIIENLIITQDQYKTIKEQYLLTT